MARHTIFRLLMLCGYLFAIGQSRTIRRASKHENIQKYPFSLEEIYHHSHYASGFNGTWISDTEIMMTKFTGDIIFYDVVTGKTTLIFDGKNLPLQYKFGTATFSADRTYILFSYSLNPAFRYSLGRKCVVYDTKHSTFEDIANGKYVMLVEWSPVGNDLVYVYENDIYHTSFSDGDTELRRLTHSGVNGHIFNGIPDWVYEEEVLKSATAVWYSPDGRHLAFATFNDTIVKEIGYYYYGIPGSLLSQYPMDLRIKYPKSGTPNPEVTLSMIDLTDPSSSKIVLEAPIDVVGRDNVLFTVSWWDSARLAATWTNRVQNQSQMIMYDTRGASSPILYDEETEGWLQPYNPVRSGDYALLLRLQDSGTSAGKFQHITRYESGGSGFTSPVDLTPGPSEVHSILGIDSRRGRVYYLATAPGEPSQRNLYSVPLDASQKPTCISCELLTPEGNKCLYATASFSTRRSYYALTCTGPDPLTVTIHDENHREIVMWKDSQSVRRALSRRLMPLRRDFNVTVNGYDSRVRLFLPPDFDESKSYPMLVYVYGGPNSARITDAVKFEYEYYMTTNRRVIYAWIDARGSAYKGSKMLFEIYRRMGTVEIADTIAVTAELQKRHSWIDASRTGIWGWSYGGFATGMVLTTDAAAVFKCGISIAPVTNWIYYDSIYTERYMGLPIAKDNLQGYARTDISQRVDGFRGKKYMLIHGSGDDNVHYQQAMLLAKSLELHDILFEQITYTDETHGLQTVAPHLYHTMDRFWSQCFNLDNAY